jgi:uncharacterized membrane protein
VTAISNAISASDRSMVKARSVRLHFLDAARGTAMLFLLISHFAGTYFDDPTRGTAKILIEIGHVATPTFILISGILVGFLYRTRPNQFEAFRVRLIDRGLFLLTITRLLMTVFCWPTMHTGQYVIITDVIGVSMIVGPWLIAHLSPGRRLAISAGLYAASWVAIESWHPQHPAGWFVEETFFGSFAPKFYLYTFPLVPWFSFELAASVVGDRLGRLYQRDDHAGMVRLLRTLAILALSLSAVAKGVYLAAVASHRFGPEQARLQDIVHILTSRLQFPPTPVYLLFYGGLGLGVLSLWLLLERRAALPRLSHFAVILGQNSLVAFVAQAAVYYTLVHTLRGRFPHAWAWPGYLALSMALVILCTLAWHRLGYRKYLTVGYRHWRMAPDPDARLWSRTMLLRS